MNKWILWTGVLLVSVALSTISDNPSWNWICGWFGGALAISALEHA